MKVIIVGGVAGGAGTAARLRRNDEYAEIILLEKDEYISFANCGLPYFIGGIITDKEELTLQTPESFNARFNVDVRVKNEVLQVDTDKKVVSIKNHTTGEEYEEKYDKLVLSPGAHPIRPRMDGIDKNHIFALRNIPDTMEITKFIEDRKPKTAVVVGAGFIGLEMAENLAERGMQVSVVDANDHVMPPLDLDMSYDVHNYIRYKGINLQLNAVCLSIGENSVSLSTGGSLPADIVIMSIGVAPTTKFLKGSGVKLGERGEIVVNQYLETSAKDVFALGDAATVTNIVTGKSALIPLAGPANKQARIVADNIVGKKTAYKGSQGTAIMKFFDMVVATTGVNQRELEDKKTPYFKTLTFSSSNAPYYPGAEMMFIKTIFHKETHKVLGAQIVGGKGVDKRIDSLAVALRFGFTPHELEEMELAYAPPFSSAKDPVNMVGYVAENIIEGLTQSFYLEDLDSLPEDAVKLDIRNSDEFELGFIPGFKHIPLHEIRDRLAEIDLTKPIYLYCRSGVRGYMGECIIRHHGGKKVYNLAGGYRHYEAREIDNKAQGK